MNQSTSPKMTNEKQLFQEINNSSSPASKPPIPAIVRRDRRLAKIRSPPSPLQLKLLSKRTPLSPPTSLTPPPSPLQRSFSDPINFSPHPSNNTEKTASLPPLPPPSLRRTSSSPVPSVSCNEGSPSSKRLKRMKERMEQMSQWCHQLISESDEQEEEPPTTATSVTEPNQEEEEIEERSEESVWVEEKPGGSLVVHFKCPCGKGYEILLSENKCYYKLM